MLRILEIIFAVFCGTFSVYFGILAAASIVKYAVDYYGLDAEEKIRGAKIGAKYFSLSAAGFFIALTVGLHNLIGLVLLVVFVVMIWLSYVIYRVTILSTDSRSK